MKLLEKRKQIKNLFALLPSELGLKAIGLSLMMLFVSFSVNAVQEQDKLSDTERQNQATEQLPNLNLKTILLDKSTREKIDRQRADYLNPKVEQQPEEIKPVLEEPKKSQLAKKPRKKPIYLPKELSVSAIIKKPDGSSLVRINGKYNQTKSKHIKLNDRDSGPQGAVFKVLNKEKRVPVGQTLLPRKMSTVANYKIEQQKKQEALPKTKDKATGNTLKDVQIITAE